MTCQGQVWCDAAAVPAAPITHQMPLMTAGPKERAAAGGTQHNGQNAQNGGMDAPGCGWYPGLTLINLINNADDRRQASSSSVAHRMLERGTHG